MTGPAARPFPYRIATADHDLMAWRPVLGSLPRDVGTKPNR